MNAGASAPAGPKRSTSRPAIAMPQTDMMLKTPTRKDEVAGGMFQPRNSNVGVWSTATGRRGEREQQDQPEQHRACRASVREQIDERDLRSLAALGPRERFESPCGKLRVDRADHALGRARVICPRATWKRSDSGIRNRKQRGGDRASARRLRRTPSATRNCRSGRQFKNPPTALPSRKAGPQEARVHARAAAPAHTPRPS